MTNVFFTSDTHFNHKLVAGIRGFLKDGMKNPYSELESDAARKFLRENADVEAHNRTIISNWNSIVTPDDIVWHLGDVALGSWDDTTTCLGQLNGKKHLITGNHDRCWPGQRDGHTWQREYLRYFESVQQYARRKIEGQAVFLSHFPYSGDHSIEDRYPQYRLRNEGDWLLHGHTHQSWKLSGLRQIHVGVDTWGLAPVPLESIAALVRGS